MRLHQFGLRPMDIGGVGDLSFLELCHISCMETEAPMVSLELLRYMF